MNLTIKVMLVFALVIGVALVTASLLIGSSAGNAYRGYMSGYLRQQMPLIASEASTLYAETGSWQEVQAWLNQIASGSLDLGRRGQGPDWQNDSSQLLLVDPDSGLPLVETGLPQPDHDLVESGVPVLLGDTTVAKIVSINAQPGLGPAEQTLLDQVNRAILFSAVSAGILALVLGSLLIASILRPLRKLEAGVAQVSQGDFETRVDITGNDEIAQLAANFNLMATSLQKQEDLRQRLVADIAHELRTPLSVIQGSLQAILDDVYPLERAEIVAVYAETQLLSRLVSDLHELAQAEAGQLSLTRQPVRVNEVLLHMADSFRSLAMQYDVELCVNSPPEDLLVHADPDRLQQILHNLLGNALRHTPDDGLVQLGANSTPIDTVRFWVHNSGPAIEHKDLSYVFSRFYRVGATNIRDSEHTTSAGLGLTIVKALVEAHGGTVGVESQVGEGTTFWFELPRDG